MKKTILPLLMTLSFFIAVGARADNNCCVDAQEHNSCCVDAQEYNNCCVDAQAHNNCCIDEKCFYAKIFSGPNFLQNTTINGNSSTYQTGYIIAGSLGYFFRYGLHLEGEYAYRRNAIKKINFFGQGASHHGQLTTSSYMANLLWDLPLCLWKYRYWNIRPFIGTGLGCDFQKMNASNSRIVFEQNWTNFSWQLMAGLVFPVFRKMEMTLEYKFHQGSSHFYNNSVGIGLVYKFGFINK